MIERASVNHRVRLFIETRVLIPAILRERDRRTNRRCLIRARKSDLRLGTEESRLRGPFPTARRSLMGSHRRIHSAGRFRHALLGLAVTARRDFHVAGISRRGIRSRTPSTRARVASSRRLFQDL